MHLEQILQNGYCPQDSGKSLSISGFILKPGGIRQSHHSFCFSFQKSFSAAIHHFWAEKFTAALMIERSKLSSFLVRALDYLG